MVAGGPGGVPARCHPQVHHGSCSSPHGEREKEGTIEARRQEIGCMGEGECGLLLDGAVKEEEGRTTNGGQTMK